MRRSALMERIVLLIMVGIMLVIGAGIVFNLRLIAATTQITRGGGIWDANQVEREALRYQNTIQRIALGDSTAIDQYALQRDLFFSRIPILRDYLIEKQQINETVTERQILDKIERIVDEIKQQDTGQPDVATANKLLPLIQDAVTTSRELVNDRRQTVMQASNDQQASLDRLRLILIFTLLGLISEIAVLIWLVRKRLDTSLQTAYRQLEAQTQDLQQSEHALQTANLAAQNQNAALEQALQELEQTVQERARLQTAMRQLEFPVIPILQQVAVMPLIGNLDATRSELAIQQALDYIKKHPVTMLLLDATGITALDEAGAQSIVKLQAMLRLLGCDSALAGVTPVMAEQLIQHNLQQMHAYNTLREGIQAVLKRYGIDGNREAALTQLHR